MTADLVVDATVSRDAFSVSAAFIARPGRPLALVGPNGSGKSTLIAAIAGLLPVTSGTITVDAAVLSSAESSMESRSRHIGVVFQDFLLFPHLSVQDNVAFALRTRGVTRRVARERTRAVLERFDLAALATRRPDQLSRGQQQRVALARAIASDPVVLLLDEPMASLDVEVKDAVRSDLAAQLGGFTGATVLVTHDADDVEALAADVVVLEHGVVTQRGALDELRRAPATRYVERLVR